MPEPLHVGYLLKQYPRFSETFILNEILGLEGEGVAVSVFSLRHATEGRFHPALASVRGQVHYVASAERADFLDAIRALPSLRTERLADVLAFVDRFPEERRARLLLQALAVADRVQRSGVNHLHAHFLTVAAYTAHIVSLLTGLPYTVTAHAKDIYRHTIDWDVAAKVAGEAAAVVTVCDANLAYLKTRLNGSGTTLTRIYNGLGTQDPPTPLAERTPGLVLGIGRLVEKKGFDLLIDAVAILATRRQDVSCAIVGDGDEHRALAARALRLGIAERVTFAGMQSQDAVSRLLRRAHVLAAPCRVGSDGNQDALPTVLLEALGAGLPSVSTPVAGIPEIVEDGRQGLLVEPNNAEALAAGIEAILDDPRRWAAMSAAGPLKLAQSFDRSRTIVQLISAMAEGRAA